MPLVDDENDIETCRCRAMHARLAAEESNSYEFRLIFERLAELYEVKAKKLEALERRGASSMWTTPTKRVTLTKVMTLMRMSPRARRPHQHDG